MNTLLRPAGLNELDLEIERLTKTLRSMEPTENDYSKIADNIKILCEAREKKNDRVLSTEMIVGVAANILGLLIVLNYEKTDTILSKAFGMLWKKQS